MGLSVIATLRTNWFWPVAVSLAAIALALARIAAPVPAEGFEAALLADVLVTLPILFTLCYRRALTGSALAVRIVALQCAGIWLASKLVPVESQVILPHLEWVRWAGLAIVLLFEIRLVIAVMKLIWKSSAKQADLEAAGMPPLLAKLAMIEARFCRWVFRRPRR